MDERVRRSACLLNASLFDAAIAELSAARQSSDVDLIDDFLRPNGPWTVVPDATAEMNRLRSAIARDPENADLHFQLGRLLIESSLWDEAELRFTQVLSIARDNVEAMIALAMCHSRRSEHDSAVGHLQRAQAARPGDAAIALLLARSAKAAQDEGTPIHVCAAIDAAVPFDHDQKESR